MKILLVHPQSKSDAKTQQQLSQPLQKMGHEVILLEDPDSLIPTLNGFWPDALVMNFFCGDLTATDMCTEIFDLFGELPSVVIHSSENVFSPTASHSTVF
jgi:DNA-binding response OmpR family regulator